MARARKNAASRPTDAYARAIATLGGAIVALVEMTTSEDSHQAQCSAFTLLNLGEIGLSGLESVFNRTRDTRLRHRIVELLRGASLTHGASALRILGRLTESDDLDPLLQA